MDSPDWNSPSETVFRLTPIVTDVLDEGAKTVPIGAEAASRRIEAALRLHRSPDRATFIMISGIALAAAVSIERGVTDLTAPAQEPET